MFMTKKVGHPATEKDSFAKIRSKKPELMM